jgi:hypothetical protein
MIFYCLRGEACPKIGLHEKVLSKENNNCKF